ncbi:MAG: hypothetical protein ABIW82_17305 [Dokdonella sp.]
MATISGTIGSIFLQDFTVTTTGEGDDELEVTGASIPEDQVQLLLRTPPGVIYAVDQDGRTIEMMLDMDEETLIAREFDVGELDASVESDGTPQHMVSPSTLSRW